MIERGGVQYEVPGKTSREILSAMTKRLPGCPGLDAEALLTAMMEREALMSTGIGKGIALPHPRTPMLGEGQLPFVAIGFPANPVEWDTPDGSTVHTVFLIVSFSARQHLTTLSYINVLCQQEGFYALVKERAPRETLIAAVRDVEAAWTDGR
jgi:PTS system nitrogen regulatory IIA component